MSNDANNNPKKQQWFFGDRFYLDIDGKREICTITEIGSRGGNVGEGVVEYSFSTLDDEDIVFSFINLAALGSVERYEKQVRI